MSNIEQGMTHADGYNSQVNKLEIIKNVSGIIRPSRLILNTNASSNTRVLMSFHGQKKQYIL